MNQVATNFTEHLRVRRPLWVESCLCSSVRPGQCGVGWVPTRAVRSHDGLVAVLRGAIPHPYLSQTRLYLRPHLLPLQEPQGECWVRGSGIHTKKYHQLSAGWGSMRGIKMIFFPFNNHTVGAGWLGKPPSSSCTIRCVGGEVIFKRNRGSHFPQELYDGWWKRWSF